MRFLRGSAAPVRAVLTAGNLIGAAPPSLSPEQRALYQAHTRRSLASVLEQATADDADLVLIAGGLFARSEPALEDVRFASQCLRRVREAERLWDELERISAEFSLPERSLNALAMAANGLRVRNATYRAASEELSDEAAGRDLRRLVDVEMLVPQGEKRGRFYRAAPRLRAIREEIIAARNPMETTDPFA